MRIKTRPSPEFDDETDLDCDFCGGEHFQRHCPYDPDNNGGSRHGGAYDDEGDW